MNIDLFRDELKKIYNKYPVFIDVLNNSDDNYIDFLYLHLNDNICLKITDNFNGKYLKKITIEPKYNYCSSLLKIYDSNLYDDEKQILNSNNKKITVYFYNKQYPNKERDKSYFFYKNRRDFLVPCFLNINTIKFLELVKRYPEEEFKKEIIYIVANKKLLTYYEVKAQMELSCLQDNLCYCDNILGKFYRRDFLESTK
jgi:hypothetical protein